MKADVHGRCLAPGFVRRWGFAPRRPARFFIRPQGRRAGVEIRCLPLFAKLPELETNL